MNASIRLLIAGAAAVLVVGVIGLTLWPRASGAGGTPTADPSGTTADPSATTEASTATTRPEPLAGGRLKPGPVVATGLGTSDSVSVTFTVPDGWKGFAGSCVLPLTGTEAPDGMGICFGEVKTGLFSDPCNGSSGLADVPVGPTVNDLAIALGAQTAYTATTPTDVTLGGYSGKKMDLQLPSDVASCANGEFYPWAGSIYAQGPNNRWHLWILDVEGDRVIIKSTSFAATPTADLAEQQAIVDSIQLKP